MTQLPVEATFNAKLGVKKIKHNLNFVLSEKEISCSEENIKFSLEDAVGCKLDSETNTVSVVFYCLEKTKHGFLCPSEKLAFVRKVLELSVQLDEKESNSERVIILRTWFVTLSWLISHHKAEMPQDLSNESFGDAKKLPLPSQRKLLFYVNPFAGTKKAEGIMTKVVRPVIEQDAGAELTVIRTTRQGHALEHVSSIEDLDLYDGIVIVSGDGLLYEVIQGIMKRHDWAKVVRKVAVGIVPAGSGNGLATSFVKAIDNTMNVDNSYNNCVLIARKKTKQMDLLAVDLICKPKSGDDLEAGTAKVERLYSFLSMEWGAQSYIDIASEKARWLGSTRFVLWALLSVFKGYRFRGELSYLPVEAENAKTPKDEGVRQVTSYWKGKDESSEDAPITELLPQPLGPVPDNWVKVNSKKYLLMWNTNVSWMATDACPAPKSEQDDGYIQIAYVDTSRKDLLGYLLSLSEMNTTDKTHAHAAPTRCYRFEPLDNDGKKMHMKYICIDGEVVEYTALQMENLCGFLKVMC